MLLAAFGVLLHRYSQQDQIGIGVPVANRSQVETEGLIGFFVNTVVVRIRLGGEPSFRDLLKGVRLSLLGAREHQDVPFEQVVEALQPERARVIRRSVKSCSRRRMACGAASTWVMCTRG